MALGGHICCERVKLAILLWSLTNGCAGHLAPPLNYMRYPTGTIVTAQQLTWVIYRKSNQGWLSSWSRSCRLLRVKSRMAMSYVSKLTFQIKSASFIFVHCRTEPLCRIHDLESQGLYSNPSQYYDFLQNRVLIVFKPKFEEPNHDHPEFTLTLSKKQNYDIVCCHYLSTFKQVIIVA